MNSPKMEHNFATAFGSVFLIVTTMSIALFIGYFVAGEFFTKHETAQEAVETKFSQLEARLDKLKATRNTNVTIRMMTNEEKNELWWKIAQVATKSGGSGKTRYNLTLAQASRVSEEFGLSVPNVFEFFRESAAAPWRSYKPPGDREEEEQINK